MPVDDEDVPQILQTCEGVLRIGPGFPRLRFSDYGSGGRAERRCVQMSCVGRESVDDRAGQCRGATPGAEGSPAPGLRKQRLLQGDFVGSELAASVPAHPEAAELGSLEKGFSGGGTAERRIDDQILNIVRQRDWAVDLRLEEGVDGVTPCSVTPGARSARAR